MSDDLTIETAPTRSDGAPTFTVSETYEASDGELCRLSVKVTPGRGWDGNMSAVRAMARDYFETFGRGVVESAKATGSWPLPPDHPNVPAGVG